MSRLTYLGQFGNFTSTARRKELFLPEVGDRHNCIQSGWDAFVLASARGTLQWGRLCPENGPCRGQWAYIGVGDDKLSVVCLQAVRALETQTTHYPEGGTDTSQQGEAWRGLVPCASRVPGSLRLTPCW